MTLKHLFGLASIAWILLWLASLVTIGGLMGNSAPITAVYLGMAVLPPAALYVLLFRALPWIIQKNSQSKPHA
jgi:hypothetical protein